MNLLMLTLVGCLVLAEPVRVEIGSQGTQIEGTIASSTPQGLHLQREDQISIIIPWYELRAGQLPEGANASYASLAQNAWRAHARLDRGDSIGALPIYQSLARTYLWEQGPQSMDVCDGLARCLISSERRKQAIEPMLAWFVAGGLPGAESYAPSSSYDEDLQVRKDLPPIFADSDAGRCVESINAPARTQLLHAYYALVAASESDRSEWFERIEELKRTYRTRDAGLVLIEQLCFAQALPEESGRRGARYSLTRRTQTQRGTWIEVWARLGIGVSKIRSDDENERDEGVIELVHIIVRLGDVEPGLTLLAAQIAQDELARTGRASWGDTLMQEAQRNIQSANARTIGTTGVQEP